MIINDLDDYYIVFDTKNRNTELDTLIMNLNLKQATLVVGLCSAMTAGYIPQANAAQTMISSPAPQGKVIKGIVMDSEGPLIGATILEKGTTNGTVTDFGRKFRTQTY